MDFTKELENRLVRELGEDYFLKEPPLLIDFDTANLQRRAKNDGLFRKLQKIYELLPEVTCGACGNVCCKASPDFYLIEYLNAWRYVRYELAEPALEAELLARSVRWAFLSFIQEGLFCPFLFDGRCVIYSARPINCRTWALEDDDWYEQKASRAAKHAKKQEEYFERNGVRLPRPISEYILPKCTEITIHGGGRISRDQIVALDSEVAFLHRALIRPEEFRSTNFNLHFPGHIALKRLDPAKFDGTRLEIARRFQGGDEAPLREFTAAYKGKLP